MSASAGMDRRIAPDGLRAGDRPILPLWLRTGVLAVVLAALFAVLSADPVSVGEARAERGEPLASRALFFHDDPDGVVRIVDAKDSREITRLAVGEHGFTRSVMRGLANERKAKGFDASEPFVLAAHADGRLYLDDPTTERQVVLTAFGPDNVQAFLRLLPPR